MPMKVVRRESVMPERRASFSGAEIKRLGRRNAAAGVRGGTPGEPDPIGDQDGFLAAIEAYSGCSPRRGSSCR